MKKILTVTGLFLLGGFVALCGFWAATGPEQDENRGLYAPNGFYRVKMPCPPPCDEKMLEAIIKEADKGSTLVMVKSK